MSSAFTDRIRWSSRIYTLQSYVEEHCSSLPSIVCACSGYYGLNDVEVISSGQIMRVHALVRQSRIYASDIRGRMFSFPESFPLKFELLDGKKSRKFRTLADIVKDCRLPVSVRLQPSTTTSNNHGNNNNVDNSGGNSNLTSSNINLNGSSNHHKHKHNSNGNNDQTSSNNLNNSNNNSSSNNDNNSNGITVQAIEHSLSYEATDQASGKVFGHSVVQEAAYDPGEGVGFWANGRWLTSSTLGTLVLIQAYSESFLQINAISQGIIQKTVVYLPLYVDIKLRIAEGFVGGSEVGEWSLLMDMYDRAVQPLLPSNDHRSSSVSLRDKPEGHPGVLLFDREEEPACYPVVNQYTGQITRDFSSNMSLNIIHSSCNSLTDNNRRRNSLSSSIKNKIKNIKGNSNDDTDNFGISSRGNRRINGIDNSQSYNVSYENGDDGNSAVNFATNNRKCNNISNNSLSDCVTTLAIVEPAVSLDIGNSAAGASEDISRKYMTRNSASGRASPLIYITDVDGIANRVYGDNSHVSDNNGSDTTAYRSDDLQVNDLRNVAVGDNDSSYIDIKTDGASKNNSNSSKKLSDSGRVEKNETRHDISDSSQVRISLGDNSGYGAAVYQSNPRINVKVTDQLPYLNDVVYREAMYQIDEVGIELVDREPREDKKTSMSSPVMKGSSGIELVPETAEIHSQILSKPNDAIEISTTFHSSNLSLEANESLYPDAILSGDENNAKYSDDFKVEVNQPSVEQRTPNTPSSDEGQLVAISAPYRKRKDSRTGSGAGMLHAERSVEALHHGVHSTNSPKSNNDEGAIITIMGATKYSTAKLAEPAVNPTVESTKDYSHVEPSKNSSTSDKRIVDNEIRYAKKFSNGNISDSDLYIISRRTDADRRYQKSTDQTDIDSVDLVDRGRLQLYSSNINTSNSTISTFVSTVDSSRPTSIYEGSAVSPNRHKSLPSHNRDKISSSLSGNTSNDQSKHNGLLVISNQDHLSDGPNRSDRIKTSNQNGTASSVVLGLPNDVQPNRPASSGRLEEARSHTPQSVLVEIDDDLDDFDTFQTSHWPLKGSFESTNHREKFSELAVVQVGAPNQNYDLTNLEEKSAQMRQSSELPKQNSRQEKQQQEGRFVSVVSNNQIQHLPRESKATAMVRPLQKDILEKNMQQSSFERQQMKMSLQNGRHDSRLQKQSTLKNSGLDAREGGNSALKKFPEFSRTYARYSPNLHSENNTRDTRLAYNSDDNLIQASDRHKRSYDFLDRYRKVEPKNSSTSREARETDVSLFKMKNLSKETRRTDDFSFKYDHLSKGLSGKTDHPQRSRVSMQTSPEGRSKVNMHTSPERKKKSAIKNTNKRGGIRRHVSYSDTDTVYPYDTSEDDQTTSVYNTGDSGLDSDNLDGSVQALYPTNGTRRHGSQYVKNGGILGGASKETGGVREMTHWAGRPSRRTLKYYKARSATLQAARPENSQDGRGTRYRTLSGPVPSLGSPDLSPLGGMRGWGSDAETGARYGRDEGNLRRQEQYYRPLSKPGQRPVLSDTDLSDAERQAASLSRPSERLRPATRQHVTTIQHNYSSQTLPHPRQHQMPDMRRSISQDQHRLKHSGGAFSPTKIILR